MTEPQSPPEAEQQIAEPEVGQPEPLYGVEDVQRALSTSGERAMAASYFSTYTAQTGKLGLTAQESQGMVDAIHNQQPWPPENVMNPLSEEAQRAANPPPEGEPPPDPNLQEQGGA